MSGGVWVDTIVRVGALSGQNSKIPIEVSVGKRRSVFSRWALDPKMHERRVKKSPRKLLVSHQRTMENISYIRGRLLSGSRRGRESWAKGGRGD